MVEDVFEVRIVLADARIRPSGDRLGMRDIVVNLTIERELSEIELFDLPARPARRIDLRIAGRELLVGIAKEREDRHQPKPRLTLFRTIVLGRQPLAPAQGHDGGPRLLRRNRVTQHEIRRKCVCQDNREREQVAKSYRRTIGMPAAGLESDRPPLDARKRKVSAWDSRGLRSCRILKADGSTPPPVSTRSPRSDP